METIVYIYYIYYIYTLDPEKFDLRIYRVVGLPIQLAAEVISMQMTSATILSHNMCRAI
jgi:hypothetical protein